MSIPNRDFHHGLLGHPGSRLATAGSGVPRPGGECARPVGRAPHQFASAFAHGHARQTGRRRLRSSNTGATAAYLATTTASSFRSRCTRTSRSDTE